MSTLGHKQDRGRLLLRWATWGLVICRVEKSCDLSITDKVLTARQSLYWWHGSSSFAGLSWVFRNGLESFWRIGSLLKLYSPNNFTDATIDSEGYKGIPLWKVILPGRKLARGFIFQNDSVLKCTSKKYLEKNRSRVAAYGAALLRTLGKREKRNHRWHFNIWGLKSSVELFVPGINYKININPDVDFRLTKCRYCLKEQLCKIQ